MSYEDLFAEVVEDSFMINNLLLVLDGVWNIHNLHMKSSRTNIFNTIMFEPQAFKSDHLHCIGISFTFLPSFLFFCFQALHR